MRRRDSQPYDRVGAREVVETVGGGTFVSCCGEVVVTTHVLKRGLYPVANN